MPPQNLNIAQSTRKKNPAQNLVLRAEQLKNFKDHRTPKAISLTPRHMVANKL